MSNINKCIGLLNSDLPSVSELKVGEFGLIVNITSDTNQYYRQRLLAQGVIPGEMLTIKNAAPFGDPIEVVLSEGRSFIIRRQEADMIKINKISSF